MRKWSVFYQTVVSLVPDSGLLGIKQSSAWALTVSCFNGIRLLPGIRTQYTVDLSGPADQAMIFLGSGSHLLGIRQWSSWNHGMIFFGLDSRHPAGYDSVLWSGDDVTEARYWFSLSVHEMSSGLPGIRWLSPHNQAVVVLRPDRMVSLGSDIGYVDQAVVSSRSAVMSKSPSPLLSHWVFCVYYFSTNWTNFRKELKN
jgi:hypothetical protein